MSLAKRILNFKQQRPLLFQHLLFLLISLSGLLLFNGFTEPSKANRAAEKASPPPMDTVIPKGWTLVPIEVRNSEALDHVLGPYGIVSLYQELANGKRKPQILVERVTILRAPRSPNSFSVLVPESEAHLILAHDAPFFVAVLNPNSRGTVFVKPKKKKRQQRILIEEGEHDENS